MSVEVQYSEIRLAARKPLFVLCLDAERMISLVRAGVLEGHRDNLDRISGHLVLLRERLTGGDAPHPADVAALRGSMEILRGHCVEVSKMESQGGCLWTAALTGILHYCESIEALWFAVGQFEVLDAVLRGSVDGGGGD